MKKLILAKIPDEFLKGNLLEDAKKDLRELTKKKNIPNTDAMRYIEKTYSINKKFSFEGVKK